uniref:Uncharacterized protein n=1 Tax=Arundo donax TaxID=35708 RepID=A0A0A9EZD3_ARUDO
MRMKSCSCRMRRNLSEGRAALIAEQELTSALLRPHGGALGLINQTTGTKESHRRA